MAKTRMRRWASDCVGSMHDFRIFLYMELAVLCFLGIFYFAGGDFLYARESDGTIEGFPAAGDVGELVDGRAAEQVYRNQMDLIEQLGVMVSDYGRESDGFVKICLEDIDEGRLAAEERFAVKDAEPGQYLYLDLPVPCRIPRGHLVKITVSSDSAPGSAPTVMYNADYQFENEAMAAGASFSIGGNAVSGAMCITVQGKDDVWTGPNYWKLVLGAAVLTAALYGLELLRCRSGKISYFFALFSVARKYGFLIQQLVARDFKTRYKRSVLGVFWSFLNPLLLMTVQYIVFSHLFKSDIQNYPVYLLSGLVAFNFFTEGVGQALYSIVGNASLITKVYLPKYIYPVTRVMSSGINLIMSLIPLMIAALLTGETFTRAYLMLPYILVCLMVFTAGFGMIMGAAMTFFRDMQFLWGVISMLWMYLTPLFYPISIIPREVRAVLDYNPMLHFVNAVRTIVLEGTVPRPMEMAACTLLAVGMLMIGSAIFKKVQDKFVFYI